MSGHTARRGYGTKHQNERAAWAPFVDGGQVTCWRCGLLIEPGTPWDLGHDDNDRTIYRGPEHARCNRAAAGKIGRNRQLTTHRARQAERQARW